MSQNQEVWPNHGHAETDLKLLENDRQHTTNTINDSSELPLAQGISFEI